MDDFERVSEECNGLNHVRFFVYGTLMTGMARDHYDFSVNRVHHERAVINGTMYDFGEFPGVFLDGMNTVYGELHIYENPKAILREFDMIEGEGSLYYRRRIEIRAADHTDLGMAYVYEIAPEFRSRGDVIESGIWNR